MRPSLMTIKTGRKIRLKMDQRPIKYKVFQGVGDYPKTNLFVMLIKCIQIQVEKKHGKRRYNLGLSFAKLRQA